jgi:hypothetical protein
VIPYFTAEAALGEHRQYQARSATVTSPGSEIVPAWLPFATTPMTSCDCPCCTAHDCGFLGLYTCVDCC